MTNQRMSDSAPLYALIILAAPVAFALVAAALLWAVL